MNARDLADREAGADLDGPETLGRGRHAYERYRVSLPDSAGEPVARDVVRVGRVIVVLPVDLARGEVVLLRQFRLGAHLATGRGDLVEVPAGHVEPGEDWQTAARRECQEEIGVVPDRLVPMFRVLPSPGMLDEHQMFMLGLVDASRVPERAGALHEREDTRPLCVPIGRALDALAAGGMEYGATVLALQWLALNSGRLHELARQDAAAG
ncbi:MAG: NUDIX hydrolase [Alphaproteobacteria bacterium]|nr:NUDIX hydrolase [Alphaproteobacteria bacterium]